MSLLGHRKHNFFGYGIEPLLDDFDNDLAEEEWALIEHVRVTGALDTDTEGSVLGRSSPSYGGYYNPAPHFRTVDRSYDAWKAKGTRRAAKHEKLAQERADEQSRKDFKVRDQQRAEELANELQRRADEEEHERKRAWALRTSYIENRINEIVEGVDVNGRDRATMRMMLRYMNLGEGVGKAWNAVEFTRYMFATRRDDLLLQNLQDVQRCYDVLRNRYVVATNFVSDAADCSAATT